MTENKVRPLASECKSESLFDPLSLVASCGLHWRLSAQPLLAHPAALGALVLVLAMAIGFSLHSLTLSFSLTLSGGGSSFVVAIQKELFPNKSC